MIDSCVIYWHCVEAVPIVHLLDFVMYGFV